MNYDQERTAGQNSCARTIVVCLAILTSLLGPLANGRERPAATQERMVEWTVESQKNYPDPFNNVEVDVVFSKDGQTWRVPAFWRGGSRWTVRFAPPLSGAFQYRLRSSVTIDSETTTRLFAVNERGTAFKLGETDVLSW